MKHFNNIFCVAGDLIVWQKGTKGRTRFSFQEMELAKVHMAAIAANDDVYYGWGAQLASGGGGRGFSKTVSAVPGIMMDVDLRATQAGVHAKNDLLPEKWDDVAALLRAIGMPEPTSLVHSGNGVYPQWLFKDAWNFASDEDRKRMAALSKDWQALIIRAAKQKAGWDFDNTSDLARVTRLPGTFNHKTDPAKPVRLVEHHEDRRFTPEELEELLVALEAKFGPVKSRSRPSQSPAKAAPLNPANDNDVEDEKPRFARIQAGCAWVRSTLERGERLPEPEWYAQASIVGRCAGGECLFHKLSTADPRYEEAEIQAKLEHALADAGPRTCENIHEGLGFEACLSCPFWNRDGFSSPLQLGRVSTFTVELMARHAFDLESGCYIDLETGVRYTEKSFSNKFRHRTGKFTPHGLVISHRFTRKVERTDYLPGVQEVFVQQERGEALNLWRPGGVTPQAGKTHLLDEHLEYIIPWEDQRSHFLDVLAHSVQKPAEKVRSGQLIIGKQGTGKSFWGRVVERMFGGGKQAEADSPVINMHQVEAAQDWDRGVRFELALDETFRRLVGSESAGHDQARCPKSHCEPFSPTAFPIGAQTAPGRHRT